MCFDFSVLISVYAKENSIWLNRAMQSIWDEQTVKPSEIVLVLDGSLTSELYAIVSDWQLKLGEVLKTIPLKNNVGLGDALNIGLQHCTNELVARMDTDDIARPDRFEKQLAVFQERNIDVCSSWISEFNNNEFSFTGQRQLPEQHEAISDYAKLRCPINHPAVMFKKTAVEKSGGYQKMLWFEDYYLWVRMLISGARFYNIQEPLVSMRAGIGQLERRSGKEYVKNEILFLTQIRRLGFLSWFEFFKITTLRIPIRLMPKPLIRMAYKFIRKV